LLPLISLLLTQSITSLTRKKGLPTRLRGGINSNLVNN